VAMNYATSNDSILSAIYAAIGELNLQLPKNRLIQPTPNTRLFGEQGRLDSLALANFIILVEDKLEERLGSRFDLTQDDPFSPENGHFRTVETLALYIASSLHHNGWE